MKLAFLGLFKKIFEVLLIAFVSFVGYQEKDYKVTNTNKDKSLVLITEVISYETETKYNDQLEKGKQNVIQEGKNGYVILNEETKEQMIEKKAINEIVEVGTYVPPVVPKEPSPKKEVVKVNGSLDTIETFVGKMTAYGGDCVGCNGRVAYVNHNLLKDGYYYNDKTFGTVRILSAAPQKFKAGTIIEIIENNNPYYGIVLDWGGAMKNAWDRGEVLIDLAFSTQAEAYQYGTRKNITFNVKRYGW